MYVKQGGKLASSKTVPPRTIAGGVAAMLLVDSVKAGNVIKVPSLGVNIGKENLSQSDPPRSPANSPSNNIS